jgi:uncharacterized membrane protein
MDRTISEAPFGSLGRKQTSVNVGRVEQKASLVGGAALALFGVKGIASRHYLSGFAMLVAGGLFLYRGKTGHCGLYQVLGVDTFHAGHPGLRVEKVVTINRPPQEVYEFWRDLQNLPRFMRHLESVQITGERLSHWKARAPGGMPLEWDTEMMDDYPGQQISWHSLAGSELPNKGTVEFSAAPGERGTELHLIVDYYPPGGLAGKAAAKLAQVVTAQQIEEDLKRLKQILETGEIATAERAAAVNG